MSPSGDLTIERVFLYSINIAFMISVGIPYMIKISLIFSRFIESKAYEKSRKRRVASRFLDFIPSSIRRMVNICPVVDIFVRKLFLFVLSVFLFVLYTILYNIIYMILYRSSYIGAISVLILFNSTRLYILAAIGDSVIHR